MPTATLDRIRTRIGEEIGVSPWIMIDQPMIDAFADITGDPQFIHVDPALAATTPFGGTDTQSQGTAENHLGPWTAEAILRAHAQADPEGGTDAAPEDRLAALVVEHEVTEVVVGEPRHLSGASGASAADATAYSQALADRMADVPVFLIDERLSTVTAASHLRQGGIDSRNQRAVIDQAAAVVILQQYLDSRRARS